MKAHLPANEIERLLALHNLAVLDTPREQSFDDVAQLAMHVCEVPIAVVSLVDQDRQWFKSCLGLDATETPRDVAFCAHAILTPDDVLVVEDATQDQRFFDNALVTAAPYIRFYAGAPLITEDGYALGTLCVIDYQPRKLNQTQLECLKALARQVIQLLRLKSMNDAVLRHSTRLQLLADRVPLLIGELSAEGFYVFANKKHRDWLSYTEESLIGKTPSDIFPPYLKQKVQAALEKSMQGDPVSIELTALSGRILDFSFLPRIENGKVQCIYEMASDVTERKIHLQVMQQERARLQSVIEGTNIGTWEWDVVDDTVNINERWATMLGYRLDELAPVTKQTWVDLLNPIDIPVAFESLENHMNGITPFHDAHFRMRKKNGQWLWVHAHGKVVERNAKGEPTLITGMHADIDAEKKIFEKLKDQEDLLRNMLSNFPGAAYRYENDGPKTIKYLSDAVFQLTGFTTEEFLWGERSLESLIHPDDVKRVKEVIAASLIEKQPFEVEYRIETASGEWRAVQEIGRGVYNLVGVLEFVDGFVWDVQAKLDEQKRIERMKNEFISTVSHELRTPLTSITGSLGLVTNNMMGVLPEKVHGMLSIAYKNSQRLTLLINDLLDMEKLLAGKMQFEFKTQSIVPLVEQAIAENKSYADKYHVTFVLDNQAAQTNIHVDGFRLQQVLNNFLSNAAKYSPAQESVTLRLENIGDNLKISVIDKGSGIPEEFKARIFQKFSQADGSDSRAKGGTGLGLSISKELVERMAGVIGFHSEPQQGTCFYAVFKWVKG